MRQVLPFLLVFCLLPAGCGDGGGSPPSGSAVTVAVVDGSGRPVPGLELVLWNDNRFLQDGGAAKAMVRIDWDQPVTARVRLTIEDIEGRRVRTLADELFAAGWWFRFWDGRDDAGVHLLSGRYTVKVEELDAETGELLGEETEDVWMAMGYFAEHQVVGTTNARGRIALEDPRLFPQFYDRPAMAAVNENGEHMGTIELDEDMVFLLRDPARGLQARAAARVAAAGDLVTVVWRPVDPAPTESKPPAHPDAAARRDDVPVIPWAVRAYPNPFN